MATIERILGTDTGKLAFEKTDTNMVNVNQDLTTHKADYAKEATEFFLTSDATFTCTGYYYKKNGWVHLQFAMTRVDGAIFTRPVQPLTMPFGFRPKRAIEFVGVQNDVSAIPPFLTVPYYFYPSGELQVNETTIKKQIKGHIVYYAGGGTV